MLTRILGALRNAVLFVLVYLVFGLLGLALLIAKDPLAPEPVERLPPLDPKPLQPKRNQRW